MRIVHLVSNLDATGSARYLSVVAPELARVGVEQFILNLGDSAPFGPLLQQAGLQVETLPWRGYLDLSTALHLKKRIAQFQPQALHVWGNAAAVIANSFNMPMVISDLEPAHGFSQLVIERTRRRASLVVDSTPLPRPPRAHRLDRDKLGIPASAKLIANVGRFDPATDQKTAVLAFDIVKYAHPDAYIVVVGRGPEFATVIELAKNISQSDERAHFLGLRTDVPEILASCDLVLITHRRGGRTLFAEAQAAGRAVVAVANRELTPILKHEQNSLVAPVGHAADLAKCLSRALQDSELVSRLQCSHQQIASTNLIENAENWMIKYQAILD